MANFSRNGKAQDPEAAEQEVVGSMMDYVQHILNKQQETTNSIKKQLAKRVAEAKWGNPARNPIEVRKEGWLQKPNPRDLARVDAAKAADDLAVLLANIVKNHAKLGVFSHQIATEAKRVMIERNYDLPEEVVEYGAAITEVTETVLMNTVVEIMTMYPEVILAETNRAMQQR
jgi:hypothetical protein